MTRRKHIFLIVGGVLGTAVITAGVVLGPFVYQLYNNPFNDRTFDRAAWTGRGGSYDWRNPRGPMANDLRLKHLRKGMTRADVHRLLGQPDKPRAGQVQGYDHYFLGCWGFMSVDGDYLVLQYNAQGRLVSTEIIID